VLQPHQPSPGLWVPPSPAVLRLPRLAMPGGMPLLGAGRRRAGGAPAFDPATTSPYAWGEASDLSIQFQGTDTSTPVAAHGDPVGRINNKGSLSFNLQQATSTRRVAYQTGSGLHWWLADGVDDRIRGTANLAASDDVEVMVALRPTNASALDRVVSWQETSNYFVSYYNGDGGGNRRTISVADGGGAGPSFGGLSNGVDYVIGASRQRNAVNGHKAWLNGVNVNSTNTNNNQVPAGLLDLFSHPVSDGQYFAGRIYLYFIWLRVLTTLERSNMVTYVGAKAGLTL